MLKLQWLQINRFRSVKPGTRLVFNPSFNVLLGQNGTGKTTLLNLVASVVSSDFTAFQSEEFDLEYELAAVKGRLSVRVRNERTPHGGVSSLEHLPIGSMRISESLKAPLLSSELRVEFQEGQPPVLIRFDGERGVVQASGLAPGGVHEASAPKLGTRLWDVLTLGFILLMQPQRPGQAVLTRLPELVIDVQNESEVVRFDESLGYFERLGEREFFFGRTEPANDNVSDAPVPAPRSFLEQLRVLVNRQWGAERYVLGAGEVPFLADVTNLLGFEAAEAIVELQEARGTGSYETLRLGNLRFLFTGPGGSRVSEKHLSYGQKRMLAFMYYQALGHSVVIADELVNGLHHRWIRACLELLGERQVFLTSQNPLLLDYLTFDSPEQVRSTFVLCSWGEGEGGRQMRWEDMSQDAAEDFYASYKVGFQQVGELLQSKGLW